MNRDKTLKYIDTATDKIVATLDDMSGKSYGIDYEGGINRLAKVICIQKYSNRVFEFAKNSGVSNWDKLNDQQLEHAFKLCEDAIFFIERDEDNFIDFYNNEILNESPGSRIHIRLVDTNENQIINFNDIKKITIRPKN